jgi:PmbA protein
MLTHDEAAQVVEGALGAATTDQAEAALFATDRGLTRLANGGIHQSVSTTDVGLQVRAVLGKRIGVARTNDLSRAGIRRVVERAEAIARVAEPNPEFVSLPGPAEHPMGMIPYTPYDTVPPEVRGDAAAALVRVAGACDVTAAGHVATSEAACAVANSLGVRAFMTTRECTLMSIMTQGDASGYAFWSGSNLGDAPVSALAERAAEKCVLGTNPITVDAGPYTVILEPSAVAEMLAMLAYIGLGAQNYREGRSFMSGHVGERVTGENITLSDDAYHPLTSPWPYDFEGVPRQKVTLIEHGVARGVVYDSYNAAVAGVANTGHALPAPSSSGPFPLHLVLEPGKESYDELIAGVERGILVTRFHYVNVVHPTETTITGMTRDGTFLIEQGRVTRPVKNLRFTQSVLEAFSHVTGMERTPTLINNEGFYALVPTLRVDGFTFTS